MNRSFITHDHVDTVIFREKRQYPRRRQVVVVLLSDEGKQNILLYLPKKATRDGRNNWCLVQGQIKAVESLFIAAKRELDEEVQVAPLDMSMHYLGSTMRSISKGHRLAAEFDDAHYHWVFAVSTSTKFVPADHIEDVRWYHAEGFLSWAPYNMSDEKRTMFAAALESAIRGPLNVPLWRRKIPAVEELVQLSAA